MSIFIAPDAEGTLTVWADVPGKDPVALVTQHDIRAAALPVTHITSPAYIEAGHGANQLWQLILENVPSSVMYHRDGVAS